MGWSKVTVIVAPRLPRYLSLLRWAMIAPFSYGFKTSFLIRGVVQPQLTCTSEM